MIICSKKFNPNVRGYFTSHRGKSCACSLLSEKTGVGERAMASSHYVLWK